MKFTDPRLVVLNTEEGFADAGMRRALADALEAGEVALAGYSVSAHIWVQAVLTDRALLLVKGAVRARVTRVPLPLTVTRPPGEVRTGVRVRTPLGAKTLWGSKLDPGSRLLLPGAPATKVADPRGVVPERPEQRPAVSPAPAATRRAAAPEAGARPTKRQARKLAGPRPRRPRRPRVRRQRVGLAPPSTIWEMADSCVKCGRPLTDPRSRRARVGTKCIRVYGSQQRKIPNPAHAVWIEQKTRADVAYVAEKARVDAAHARALAEHEQARAEWARVRASWSG